jgi:ferrous iron transport protein B
VTNVYAGAPHARKLSHIALVGNPNVGKSVLFNVLTGSYVTVSNYPGTTVEISSGRAKLADGSITVTDTPGMYSLVPITEEERVARELILEKRPDMLVHVVDAKNIERMLPLTLQLIEAGLPVILDLNMMDEAEKAGVKIDPIVLERELGIDVVCTVLTKRQGIAELLERLTTYRHVPKAFIPIRYDTEIEKAAHEVSKRIKGEYGISKRALSLMLLQGDEALAGRLKAYEREYVDIEEAVDEFERAYTAPVNYRMALLYRERAQAILSKCVTYAHTADKDLSETVGRLLMRPVLGIPVLLAVLYFGLYRFVGVFGAGVVVDLLESCFVTYINPVADRFVESVIPYPVLQDLFAHEYGIITLGLRYAFAIVLPIVGAFFFVFAIIEDSGYLPRLAMLVDRLFKVIGLTGRAVIPMTLGFGCDTMATVVTRTLETRKERVIATLLLALAIPCSAQLGIILALLSAKPKMLLLWGGFVLFILLFVGYLSSKVIPGRPPEFYMEVPPLRLPSVSNVFVKTYARMYWYALEVLPLFMLASALIWVGKLTGLFDLLLSVFKTAVTFIDLPEEAASTFLFGFFRRDYGTATLYDLQKQGALSDVQLVVSAATLTLFIPCIAQFAVMIKERGIWTALGITAFILPFAFFSGYMLNMSLRFLGF